MHKVIPLLIGLVIVAGCSSSADVVQVGTDTYSIRKESRVAVLGIEGLKTSAVQEATSYCERYSATADVLSESDSSPSFIVGRNSWFEVRFRCNRWQ